MMSANILDLARPELREITPYTPGEYESGFIRMNANESPYQNIGDNSERGLNIYPPPRPLTLQKCLAEHYYIEEKEILMTRGSSEAIDILIRGFCTASKDSIVICSPTFDMYRLYANIQNVNIHEVPLLRNKNLDQDFQLDSDAIIGLINSGAKMVFLCTPNNPTGGSMQREDIKKICNAARGRSLVIIDEAYSEFSSQDNYRAIQKNNEYVVCLRTLSKFVSLAGVRCGAVIAAPKIIKFLEKVLPPYTFPTPSIELVLKAFQKDSLKVSEKRNNTIIKQREILRSEIAKIPTIDKVWPSDSNFFLIKTNKLNKLISAAKKTGVLIRSFENQPMLKNCARISVNTPENNDIFQLLF